MKGILLYGIFSNFYYYLQSVRFCMSDMTIYYITIIAPNYQELLFLKHLGKRVVYHSASLLLPFYYKCKYLKLLVRFPYMMFISKNDVHDTIMHT